VFDPRPDWYEQLPRDAALRRLEEAPLELWPDITDAERIGLGWALLVSDREEELWERSRAVPGFRWSAVGLLDPEVDRELVDGPPFGVILYAEDERGDEEGRAVDAMWFEEIALPVVVRTGRYEDHQFRGGSIGGSGRAACWATSRGGTREGWLTAKHVARVLGPGVAVDYAPECIDAALVDLGGRGGGAPHDLALPAVGGMVDLHFARAIRGTILDVSTNLGVRRSRYFPLRFSVNAWGVPGDSGGLMIGQPCGEPMGLYLGAFTDASGARAGVGLALVQVKDFIDLEVYG
jgi:hypothetical protein